MKNRNAPNAAVAQWRGRVLREGLGLHRVEWEELRLSNFNAHPALCGALWDRLVAISGSGRVELWERRQGAQVQAMCLLVYTGSGRWKTFDPQQAAVAPFMVPEMTWVEELLLALGPGVAELELRNLNAGICKLMPHPAQRACITPQSNPFEVDDTLDGQLKGYNLRFFGPGWAGLVAYLCTRLLTPLSARRLVAGTPHLSIEALPMNDAWPTDVAQALERWSPGHLESRVAWLRNLWGQVFSEHPAAHLWVMRRQGAVVAALPILQDDGRFGQRVRAMVNYYSTLLEPALSPCLSTQELSWLFSEVKARLPKVGQFSFEPLDPEGRTFHQIERALEAAGFICHRYFRFGNWYLPRQANYAEYLSGRTSGLRSTVKRMSKRCADAGAHIDIFCRPEDVDGALAAYWKAYSSSWKQEEPHPAFIDGLVRWCAQDGILRLGVLSLRDEPIAAQIWLVYGGKASIYKVAYNEAHKALSPATVLTAALMEHVLDVDKVREVDFLMGDDPYKRNWMSARRERWGLAAYAPFRLEGATGLVRLCAGRVLRRLINLPLAKSIARGLQA